METEFEEAAGLLMDAAEEQALVDRLKAMDAGAWETFCGAYSRALLTFVHWSCCCSPEQAEDIVQMTFVRCVRSIRTVDLSRGRLLTWLKAVARNEAATFLRRDGRSAAGVSFAALQPSAAEEILRFLDISPLPEEILAREDVREGIRCVLRGLKPRYREALIGKYVDGMSMAELASELSVSRKAIESILSRARAAFREALCRREQQADMKPAETRLGAEDEEQKKRKSSTTDYTDVHG